MPQIEIGIVPYAGTRIQNRNWPLGCRLVEPQRRRHLPLFRFPGESHCPGGRTLPLNWKFLSIELPMAKRPPHY